MSQVLVWKSDYDGKLFESKTFYLRHLRKLAADRITQRKQQLTQQQRKEFTQQMSTVRSINELTQFVKNNWPWFFKNGTKCENYKKLVELELIDFTLSVTFSNNIRNTHFCPHNGVVNWTGREKFEDGTPKPQNYPGWYGTVSFVINGKLNSIFGSTFFENTRINVGAGSGGFNLSNGTTKYSFEVMLFADDFPVMADAYQKALMWKVLSS